MIDFTESKNVASTAFQCAALSAHIRSRRQGFEKSQQVTRLG
jgi:hypothetical protein